VSKAIFESDVEEFALVQLAALGYDCINGEDIAPEAPASERASFGEVILRGRLEEALRRLNPGAPEAALEEALRKVTVPLGASLLQNNRAFHRMLRDGVEVEIPGKHGETLTPRLRLVDFDDPDENDWLAVNQFTIVEGHHNRRPDIILFVNGLPLVVFELKNLADETATIQDAYQQVQTYKQQIPSLFVFNELVVLSDGFSARVGTFTAPSVIG
jgi:type I restriction enzyme R subunit